jgi:hypothetical protein
MPDTMRVRLTQPIIEHGELEDYPVFLPKGSIGNVLAFSRPVNGLKGSRYSPRRILVSFPAAFVGSDSAHCGGTIEDWEIDVDANHLEFVDVQYEAEQVTCV